jgi:circadian clock protein KaiB
MSGKSVRSIGTGAINWRLIEIYQQPTFAKKVKIVAAPTLVKELPPPLRRFIGDMSQTEKVLVSLDLHKKKYYRGATP